MIIETVEEQEAAKENEVEEATKEEVPSADKAAAVASPGGGDAPSPAARSPLANVSNEQSMVI